MFLATVKKLVEVWLSCNGAKRLVKFPTTCGAKITGEQLLERTSDYLNGCRTEYTAASAEVHSLLGTNPSSANYRQTIRKIPPLYLIESWIRFDLRAVTAPPIGGR